MQKAADRQADKVLGKGRICVPPVAKNNANAKSITGSLNFKMADANEETTRLLLKTYNLSFLPPFKMSELPT